MRCRSLGKRIKAILREMKPKRATCLAPLVAYLVASPSFAQSSSKQPTSLQEEIAKCLNVSEQQSSYYKLITHLKQKNVTVSELRNMLSKDRAKILLLSPVAPFLLHSEYRAGMPPKYYRKTFLAALLLNNQELAGKLNINPENITDEMVENLLEREHEAVKKVQEYYRERIEKMSPSDVLSLLQYIGEFLLHFRSSSNYIPGPVNNAIKGINMVLKSNDGNKAKELLMNLLTPDGKLGFATTTTIALIESQTSHVKLSDNILKCLLELQILGEQTSVKVRKPEEKTPDSGQKTLTTEKPSPEAEGNKGQRSLLSPSSPYSLLNPLASMKYPFLGTSRTHVQITPTRASAQNVGEITRTKEILERIINDPNASVSDYIDLVGDREKAEKALEKYRETKNPEDLLVGNLSGGKKYGEITFITITYLGGAGADIAKKLSKYVIFGVDITGDLYFVEKYSPTGQNSKYLLVPTFAGYVAFNIPLDNTFRVMGNAHGSVTLGKPLGLTNSSLLPSAGGNLGLLFGDPNNFAFGVSGGIDIANINTPYQVNQYSANLITMFRLLHNSHMVLFLGYDRVEDVIKVLDYITAGLSVAPTPWFAVSISGGIDPKSLERFVNGDLVFRLYSFGNDFPLFLNLGCGVYLQPDKRLAGVCRTGLGVNF